MNNKGIVFFDVDGTLIDWTKGIHVPTKATKDSINKLKENGYLTILATGRPKSSITDEIEALGLNGYIASNGAYAEIENEVMFNECINNRKLKELLGFLEENDIVYILEGQEKNYVLDINNEKVVDLVTRANLSIECFTEDWNKETVKTSKIIAMGKDENSYGLVCDKFSKEGYSFMENQFGHTFEIYISKYTKGYGVDHLLGKLGMSREKAYAFGDGENDIEMFQVVKHGIAMGGHHEGLKEHSYDFTEDVANEGIQKGLKKLGLI
ncbi:Cof-type HAD-IIB family hydrolase [Clostridium sp. AL.422]|uniref:Cof-type HAD-IIB family hydrolase n=1 Tax=Clostridium TaxID=1485 RepID=UPI00293DC630|nr:MULTISPECIES: Cof-type HAD-IIB family hydrolase [unclassified Clostridium]MDV4150350.1 Cof-type HAD-IIB family hydrolase [Clostridium sp. AL.422]